MSHSSVNIAVVPMRLETTTEEMIQHDLAAIRKVNRRVNVTNIGPLMNAERKGDGTARQKLDGILADAEIIYANMPFGNIFPRVPKLKWIHTPLAGAERILTPEVVRSPIVVTNSRFHGPQIGELTFNLMLMLARQSPRHYALQREKKWQPIIPDLLWGKTLGILGLGNIGQAVAHLGKAFHMRVIALRAHPEARSKNVDAVYPPSALKEMLGQSDFAVVILPLTSETRNIIGEAELRAMKPTAYLINVGRGGLVDEDALLRALTEKRIAGAGLDVFATEPLPAESPFWEMPNVIVSPHNAGQRKDYFEQATVQFCQNLRRYLRGLPLRNIVDKQRGY